MQGKRVMVTGATGGIGLVTARELARQGAEVIVVGRDAGRSAAAVAQIKEQSGNDAVTSMLADLSSQQAIHTLADDFKRRYDRLDVLVNNAGLMFTKRQESVDGIEMTWALNHLGYFLLTNLLLDTLKASGPARIVSVSSSAHVGAKLNFADLEGRQSYGGYRAYSRSKLANVMFTYELARRLQGMSVTANCLHPGVVATNFAANNGGFYRAVLRPILNVVSISPEKGAATSVYLASSPEVDGVTGKYFDKQKPVASSKVSYDQAAWERLWEVSEQYTHLKAYA
ncbi:MAG: SDR family oxidoreductase [Herpetosiphonaceae bacterium]|nr:SDR family oxidoreductase [Herpetosiphonaceae bacterium]